MLSPRRFQLHYFYFTTTSSFILFFSQIITNSTAAKGGPRPRTMKRMAQCRAHMLSSSARHRCHYRLTIDYRVFSHFFEPAPGDFFRSLANTKSCYRFFFIQKTATGFWGPKNVCSPGSEKTGSSLRSLYYYSST